MGRINKEKALSICWTADRAGGVDKIIIILSRLNIHAASDIVNNTAQGGSHDNSQS